MALQHNHSLLAARTTIQQNEAEEITANLRPNPVLLGDAQFLPIFQPNQFSSRLPRQHGAVRFGRELSVRARQEAAAPACRRRKDATAVTRSQVADNERSLTFNVAQQFTNVELAESTLELAQRRPEELSEHGGHQRGAI